jgi:hypothetical protein
MHFVYINLLYSCEISRLKNLYAIDCWHCVKCKVVNKSRNANKCTMYHLFVQSFTWLYVFGHYYPYLTIFRELIPNFFLKKDGKLIASKGVGAM